jgi:hypothetical protein
MHKKYTDEIEKIIMPCVKNLALPDLCTFSIYKLLIKPK